MSREQGVTRVNLACRDGELVATFQPALAPWQYEKICKLTGDTDDRALLRVVVEMAAQQWAVGVTIEDT